MASNLPVEVAGVGTFDNVEALLSAIEEGRIEQDPEFIKDIEEAVCCIDEETYVAGVPCEFCSFGSLNISTTHVNFFFYLSTKHPHNFVVSPSSTEVFAVFL